MIIDFTAAEVYLDYLDGRACLREVLCHPAYLTVGRHIAMFSEDAYTEWGGGSRTVPPGILEKEILNALTGKRSAFYGLKDLTANLPGIRSFLELLRARAGEWGETIQQTLAVLFPKELPDITVYPILGYDKGIGLNGAACLNCNTESYLKQPEEFLFYAIHECTHVIYERYQRIPALWEIVSAADWRSYFNLWTQNEGYAVYAPLRLRQKRGFLAERDYRVLFDTGGLQATRLAFLEAIQRLDSGTLLPREAYLDLCFGSRRLTYQMGCELVRRIEKVEGMESVRQAFELSWDDFIVSYRHLLET